jgi:lipoprotein-anchoring transpeptidase ErfK/SrfK
MKHPILSAAAAAALFALPATSALAFNAGTPPRVLSPDLSVITQDTPQGGTITIPGESEQTRDYPLPAEFMPQVVSYQSSEKAGTIIIDTISRHLYLIMGDGKALRYGVGVGRPGFEWAGVHYVTRKAEWPDWTPPVEMLKRQPGIPTHMAGGLDNPLGARALYLGSTLYRIHGTAEPWTIGQAVSSGCIRMRNEDVVDLYRRVGVGTKVIVM